MPKPRTRLTPLEEAIVSKGGEPGTGLAQVEPIKPKTVKAAPEEPDEDDAKDPLYRHTMVRFKPALFEKIKSAVKDQSEELSMKVSLNSWIISACVEKLKRDRK